ncbi:hypothetical protein JNK13_02105 [bacterium]|nr:hypothetical protein [bacterium]
MRFNLRFTICTLFLTLVPTTALAQTFNLVEKNIKFQCTARSSNYPLKRISDSREFPAKKYFSSSTRKNPAARLKKLGKLKRANSKQRRERKLLKLFNSECKKGPKPEINYTVERTNPAQYFVKITVATAIPVDFATTIEPPISGQITKLEQTEFIFSATSALHQQLELRGHLQSNNAKRLTPLSISIPAQTTLPAPQIEISPNQRLTIPKPTALNSQTKNINFDAVCYYCSTENIILTSNNQNFSVEIQDIQRQALISSIDQNYHSNLRITAQITPKQNLSGNHQLTFSAMSNDQPIAVSGQYEIRILPDSEAYPTAIFVEPNTGSDLNSGSPTQPVSRLSRALTLAYDRFVNNPNQEIKIFITGKSYFDTGGITLDQSKIPSQGRLEILALDGTKPELIAGRPINSRDWQNLGNHQWQHCNLGNIPADDGVSDRFALYINNRALVPARFPNQGFIKVTKVTTPAPTPANPNPQIRFEFDASQLPQQISSAQVNITYFAGGYKYFAKRDRATLSGNTIVLNNSVSTDLIVGNDFYIENHASLLDGSVTAPDGITTNEFFFDGSCVRIIDPTFDPQVHGTFIATNTNRSVLNISNTIANPGQLHLEGLSFKGGINAIFELISSDAKQCGDASSNALLLLDNSARDISVVNNAFGPSLNDALLIKRFSNNILVHGNIFTDFSGSAIIAEGRPLISEAGIYTSATVSDIEISENVINEPNPYCINGLSIQLNQVANVKVSENAIFGIRRRAISILGTRYGYLGPAWCNYILQPSPLSRCAGDPTIEKLPWLDAQQYIATKNILIERNYIRGILAPSQDSGMIMAWGLPYDINGGHSISINENVIINETQATKEDHVVGVYFDDGANGYLLQNNIIFSEQGSFYGVIAKGYSGSLYGNLIINAEESKNSMLAATEFAAIAEADKAHMLEFNRELARNLTIIGNGFFQTESTNEGTASNRLADFYHFFTWDPSIATQYGYSILESSGNIFHQTQKSFNTSAMAVSGSGNSFSLPAWSAKIWSNGRTYDQDLIIANPDLPPTTEMLAGKLLPRNQEVRLKFASLEELKVGSDSACQRYGELCLKATIFKVD